MKNLKTVKGALTLKILEIVGGTALAASDVISAFLSAGYGASYGQLSRELREIEKQRSRKELEFQERQKLYNLIYQLKSDGLIQEKRSGKKRKILTLTPSGKKKTKFLNQKLAASLPKTKYEKKENNKATIIIFDIPEKERRKRNWLRGVLKEMGFRMIQKSVWIGKIKIPQNFLIDLQKLKMIDCVKIFEVEKLGSLQTKLK